MLAITFQTHQEVYGFLIKSFSSTTRSPEEMHFIHITCLWAESIGNRDGEEKNL